MSVKNVYYKMLKQNIHNPDRILRLMQMGLNYEIFRVKHFSRDKYALKYLNEISLNIIKRTIERPESSVWVNLFVPCEVIHAFDLNPICIEYYASFLAGFQLQNIYLDKADNSGLSDTLCSYHKAFIGAVEGGIVPRPVFSTATSTICDANNSTFAYLSHKWDIPYFLLDIPHEKNEASVRYVYHQLLDMIKAIEEVKGQKFDIHKLKKIIHTENKTLDYIHRTLPLLSWKSYSKTMTQEMYMLNTAHVYMGTPESFHFYKNVYNEVKNSYERKKRRILWVHTMPFPFRPFRGLFGEKGQFEIITMELNHPDTIHLDEAEDPLMALSEKIIDNIYNGSYERKIEKILNLADILKVYGVIQFCHLGCRQNSGGMDLLREALKSKNIPFLPVDGDGLDMRKNQQGQLITRVEAFLEIIVNKEERMI